MQCIALHSSQSHGGQWRALSRQLPESYMLQAPDLIGYGAAPTFAQCLVAAADFRLANEITALVQTGLQPERGPVVLVGHSYGGALALHWARRFPQAVAALVLYEPVAFHVLAKDHAARAEISAVANAMDTMSAADACTHFVDYWNSPGYFNALPAAAQALMISQQDKVTADFKALLGEPASLADYAKLTMPVHLFSGEQSPLSSQTVAQLLANTLPNATHTRVAAGHMGPITHSRIVTPLLLKALLTTQPSSV